MNFKATFQKVSGNQMTYIGKVTEGRFVHGEWVEERWLNGDETYHHELLRALGREISIASPYRSKETDLTVKQGDQFVYSPGSVESIIMPAMYKVILYQRSK
jgi:hypothetical protein